MSPRLRAMVGVITVALFAFFAASFLMEGRTGIGAALAVFTAFRAIVLVGQIRRAFSPDE